MAFNPMFTEYYSLAPLLYSYPTWYNECPHITNYWIISPMVQRQGQTIGLKLISTNWSKSKILRSSYLLQIFIFQKSYPFFYIRIFRFYFHLQLVRGGGTFFYDKIRWINLVWSIFSIQISYQLFSDLGKTTINCNKVLYN